MAGSGELWVQCFTCCLAQQESSTRNGRQRTHQRLRIDRSMIGVPTNFRHITHISSRDLDISTSQLSSLQSQMQMKDGYNTAYSVKAC